MTRSARAILQFGALLFGNLALTVLLPALSPAMPQASAAPRPKIRAITAFVRLSPPRYQQQVEQALGVLRKVKARYENAGYEVETLRITTQPFPEFARGMTEEQALAFFNQYDQLVTQDGLDAAIGPAMLRDSDNPKDAELLAKILASTTTLEGTVVIASDDGIHWKSIHAAASVIEYLAAHTLHSQGNFRFAAIAMLPPGSPFYPASYHLGPGSKFAIGLESANVVAEAMTSKHDPVAAQKAIEKNLGGYAREIEAIAQRAAAETGWAYTGIDLSPAPLKDVSIGAAIEGFTGAKLGSPGTLTAAALITQALREIRVTHTGYSGLMLPVLEDSVIAKRWSEGDLSLDSLLSYSAVCGTGLDVIPLPGSVPRSELEKILSDVASLAYKWRKPLSARLFPVEGKRPGQLTEFNDPFLVNARIQPLP